MTPTYNNCLCMYILLFYERKDCTLLFFSIDKLKVKKLHLELASELALKWPKSSIFGLIIETSKCLPKMILKI